MMKKLLNRRQLIQCAFASAGAFTLPITLTACGGSDDQNETAAADLQFLHGVASGDPLQDKVILWTRVTVADLSLRIELEWEIALDRDFKNIQNSGKVQTSNAQDFTVKVDADKLKANQRYFYLY